MWVSAVAESASEAAMHASKTRALRLQVITIPIPTNLSFLFMLLRE